MSIVGATFVRREVEPGWPILGDDVPTGKRYRIDLDRIRSCVMKNADTGKSVDLDVVWVVDPEPAGWLPLMALKVDAS